jgi:LPXTG-motif cell wall-anchored protein
MSYDTPPPPPPPQYGAPPPGGAPKRSGMALAGFILAIIGVIPCFWGCLIFSILGLVFGQLGKRDIAQSAGAKTGDTQAKWAVILGAVGLALGVIYWILVGTGVIDIDYSGNFDS